MSNTLGELLDHPQDFQSWLHQINAFQSLLQVLARTCLLDQWDSQPAHLSELAPLVGIPEAQLGRLINLLVSQGVLTLTPDGAICHTPRSRALQTMHSSIRVQGMALQAGLSLSDALRTGKTGFEVCFGAPAFDYLAANPEMATHFAGRMSQITLHDEPLVLAQLQFEPFRLAVDIGGSHGTLLLGLLAKQADARGIVFDLPDVAAQATERLRSHLQGHRVEAIGGDFLRSVPAGGDIYLLKQILHNWDDTHCLAILKSVRAAIAPTGRIVVIDRLLPETIAPDMAFEFDLLMMIWCKGRERSLTELRQLLASAGFAVVKVQANPGRLSVVEAVPI